MRTRRQREHGRWGPVAPRLGRTAFVALVLSGCAASSTPPEVIPSVPDPHLFTLGVGLAEDHRDVSRFDIVAPELRAFFDPSRDLFGFESAYNPFMVQFASGKQFRWDQPPERMIQDALVSELGGSNVFRWVRPQGSGERPRFVLHTNILALHYQKSDRILYPQVQLEGLVLDGTTREVRHKARGRVTDEFGVLDQTGSFNQHIYTVEDWQEPELREQFRRSIEKCAEILSERLLEDFFYHEARGESPPSTPGGGG